MKKTFLVCTLALAFSSAFAADFSYTDSYSKLVDNALSTDGKAPASSVWQEKNRDRLDAAMTGDEIKAFTDSAEAADALLSRVKPAYATPPMDACRIAEVTHWVMVGADAPWYAFWRAYRDGRRRLWTEALLRLAMSTSDEYVMIFCLDQLRWCGYEDQTAAVASVGVKSGTPHVQDYAKWVVRELSGVRIGK